MGCYKSIYGEVTFKTGLSPIQVGELYEITECKFTIGETDIEFNDDWFDLSDLVEWLEKLPKGKVISGYVTNYGDYPTKFEYDPETKQWNEYEREFLCDLTDDTLIGELKSRGYKVTKEDGST